MAIRTLRDFRRTTKRYIEVIVNHPPKTDSHRNAAERERREAALDETIEQSFPASDPPSSDPNPDIHDAITRETSEDDKPHPPSDRTGGSRAHTSRHRTRIWIIGAPPDAHHLNHAMRTGAPITSRSLEYTDTL
jgi:hypothetical protein